MTGTPVPRFGHLLAMTDDRGTFEHARFTTPRQEHGYCTDDMARVVVVTAREPSPSTDVSRLVATALRFVIDAQADDGRVRNRMDVNGRWTDVPTFEDCWGRSLWAFGTVAATAEDDALRLSALDGFERGAQGRSPSLRSMMFAALGAAEVLDLDPTHAAARALLSDAAGRVEPAHDATWPWPEARLAYANAVIPEVLIAAGSLLDRPDLLERGLDLLRWLLDRETFDGHLSVTPVGGRQLGDAQPAFDQQPIEVAALADACARAARAASDPYWERGVALAIGWFLGHNDGGHVMWDARTGGGFDGLRASGPNLNQGAESTLALLSTLQHARRPIPA